MKQFTLQRILGAFLLCFATFAAQAQVWTWATQAIANSSSINHRGMATDATGNFYTCGYRMENPNGPCLGGFWLGKYTPAGTKVYEVLKLESTVSCNDRAVDLAVDPTSNRVFVVGSANGKPAVLIFNASTGSYLSKINFGGSGGGGISGIDYRSGFIYVVGSYTGQVTITDGGGTTTLTGGGVFVAKFNAATGVLVLSKRIYPATAATLYAHDIKTSNTNGVYISLSTRSNILLQGSTVYTYPSTGYDAVLMSLNSSFNFTWAKQADNHANAFAREMPVFFHKPNSTAIYIYIGVARGNNESRLKRYTTAGALISSNTLTNRTLLDVTASTCGKVYVTGCTAQVGPEAPCWTYPTNLFVTCHTQTTLAQEWIMQSAVGCASGEGIVTDLQGNPVVCGDYYGSGPNTLEFGANIVLTAGSRSFVAHLTSNTTCCATGNYAIDFDGVNDYIQTSAAPLTGNANFTIEAWFRTTASNNAFRRLIGWGGTGTRFELGVKNGKLAYYHYPGGMNSEATLSNIVNDNAWHQLVATRNGNTLVLYLDGVQVMQKTLTNVVFNFGTPFCIGRWPGGSNPPGQNWLGQVDEIRVWNTARTLTDINATRFCRPAANTAGLVLYYDFALYVGGTTTPNVVQPNNTGTLYNFAIPQSWLCSNLFLPACFFSPTVDDRTEEAAAENVLTSPTGAATLFPNPASQEVTIQLAQTATSPVVINVYNLSGQVLRQQIIAEGDQSIQMDVSDLPPSLYLVEIQLASGQKEVLKMMKQ